jgi:hypothetical protein
VNFVGTKRGKYDAFISQSGLDRHISYIGYVPHATSLQYLLGSDVLFLAKFRYTNGWNQIVWQALRVFAHAEADLALTCRG